MSVFSISKTRRASAGVLGILLLTFLVFSAFYIAVEADHNCSGDDCLICSHIQLCSSLLRQFSEGSAVWYPMLNCIISFLFFLLLSEHVSVSDSPVARKVRMND